MIKQRIVNGIQFDSIVGACRYFSVKYGNVKSRMQSTGETLEQAINYYIQHGVKQHSQPVAVNGKHFDSHIGACTYFNVRPETVKSRMISTGETLEKAINYYIQHGTKQKSQPAMINGIQFNSARAACRYFSVERNHVKIRIKSGDTLEQAINYCIQQKDKKPLQVVNGKQFETIKEACQQFGVSYNSVLGRMKSGESLEKAINYCIQQGVKLTPQLAVSGKQYKSVSDMNNALNICSYGSSIDIVLKSLISQGYIQQLDGSFLKIR